LHDSPATTSQVTTQVPTMEHEAHNPALLHHFADAQQQKNAASLGLLGLTFLVIKGFEYKEKFEKHHVPGSTFNFTDKFDDNGKQIPVESKEAELFFSLYFVMTGMHAIHMIIGCGLFGVLTVLAWKGHYTSNYFTPIENAGLYWHFVDIVWIYLFPLLYLISRHS
jgi:cytochrome c oxidase subunit 3